MTYLLTGATGLIGRGLVERLLTDGHVVNYFSGRRSRLLDSRASFHSWPRNGTPEFQGVPRLDVVINLAGEPIAQRWTEKVKRRIYDSRVEGTRKLVDGLSKLRHKPSVLVSASAVGYYGNRGEETLTESSPPGSGFLVDVCAGWEREALRAQEFGMRVVVIRIAPALSPNGGALKKMLFPFRLGLGGKLGDGRQWMPWIHLDDLVRLMVFVSTQTSLAGVLNGCSPQPVRNAEFARALGGVIGRPTFFSVPKFALQLALGELADFLLDSQRVIPRRAEQAGFPFEHPEIREALSSLLH